MAATRIDFDLDPKLSETDRARVIDNFGRARSHLSFTCELKLVVWEHLPLRQAGLSDPDDVCARVAAVAVTEMYDRCPHKSDLRWTARKLNRQGGRLRAQLDDFIRGERLESPRLRKLRRFIGQYVLASTCERSVEGIHAKAQQRRRWTGTGGASMHRICQTTEHRREHIHK